MCKNWLGTCNHCIVQYYYFNGNKIIIALVSESAVNSYQTGYIFLQ